ncbi:MAG: hypothetical protein ACI8QC_002626 [Planctomycetota bacterium]
MSQAQEAPLKPGWILGPRADALAFSGPVIAGLGLVAWAASRGNLHAPISPLLFLILVALIDVGHVYATVFRVYLDPSELRRRPALYLGIPLGVYAGSVLLYAQGPMVFWRVLAYLAVYHFVRQQWGWMAYARRRAGESGLFDLRLDKAAIYAATLYPLLYWHTHLPADFEWFIVGDFVALPAWADTLGLGLHHLVLGLFFARQVQRAARGLGVNYAKLQILISTWIAWFGGIVILRSDLAFTALNVLSHGVPYLAFVWTLEHRRRAGSKGWIAALFTPRFCLLFLALLGLVGYAEEWLWDRSLWHEPEGLFPGPAWFPSGALVALLVPLLALPQATHYLLDGWIWRTRNNPSLAADLSPSSPSSRPGDATTAPPPAPRP